jgi:aspartate racemase
LLDVVFHIPIGLRGLSAAPLHRCLERRQFRVWPSEPDPTKPPAIPETRPEPALVGANAILHASMKTIGMIGGMSWESSVLYYRMVNQETKRRLGGHHNARSVMVTVDFSEVEKMQRTGDWHAMGLLMADTARQIERAGADFIILCTNTTHKVAESIESAARIPLLHIADATAQAVQKAGQKRVGLLGTRFTMEQPFIRERLEKHEIEVITPDEHSREAIHRVIYGELVLGITRPESRDLFRGVIGELAGRGAESVILGCTEIGLLIQAGDSPVPLHDTTVVHAIAAVDWALQA